MSVKSVAARKNTKAKVLLVDDHPVVREGLIRRINREPDLTVCAEAGDPVEAMAAIRRHQPDLVIVDIGLENAHGLELVKDIKAQHPLLAVLVFSMHGETLYAERALRAGARGYLMKQEPPQTLLRTIRQILAGEVYLSPLMTKQLLRSVAVSPVREDGSPAQRLSDRELEIIDLIGHGWTTRDIARILRLSPKTVASHRENLKHKLRMKNSAELLRYAIEFARERAPKP